MNTLRLSFCLLLLLAQAAVAPLVQAQSEDCPAGETCQPSDDEVIGVSIILTPLEMPISTYSATILGSAVAANYDPAMDAELFGNMPGSPSDWIRGSYGYYGGYDMVEGSISTSLAFSSYFLHTAHYVRPYVDDEEGESDGDWYLDPMDFQNVAAPDGQGYMEVYGDATGEWIYPDVGGEACGGLGGYECVIEVGSTYDSVERIPPTISSITTTVNGASESAGVNLNSSGILTIMGTSLEDDGSDPYPSVCVNGICASNGTPPATSAGLTLSNVAALSDTEIRLSYSVDGQASSVGPHSITVMTDAGTSIGYSFTVGDPTPKITGVSPSSWQAGTTQILQSFSVTGSGFGTSPKVSITHTDGSAAPELGTLTVTPGTDSYFTASVFIAADAPTETFNLTVTSQGYGAVGATSFLPSYPSDSSTSSASQVDLNAAPPAPTIVWVNPQDADPCAAARQVPAVVVGQRITVAGCLPAAVSPANVSSQDWSYPAAFMQNVVAGYNPAAINNQQVSHLSLPIGCDPSQPSCSFPAFFPVSPGSPGPYTLTYTYVLSNGTGSKSISVALQVAGPTATGQNGAFFTATPTTALDVWPAGTAFGGQGNAPGLELGDGNENVGIAFNVTANPPAAAQGSFLWVQLINNHTTQYRANPAANNTSPSPGLDNWFPYVTHQGPPKSTNDSPGAGLSTTGLNPPANSRTLGEVGDTFSATMYLLWDPAMNAAGQTGTCAAASNAVAPGGQPNPQPSQCASIPVPVGNITWAYSGNGINTLANQANRLGEITTWVLGGCLIPLPAEPAFTPSTSYPIWNAVVQNVH